MGLNGPYCMPCITAMHMYCSFQRLQCLQQHSDLIRSEAPIVQQIVYDALLDSVVVYFFDMPQTLRVPAGTCLSESLTL